MIRIKGKYRLLCILLVLFVLIGAFGVLYLHGEWWFPLLQQLERHEKIGELLLEDDVGTRRWSLEELTAREDVTQNRNLMLVNGDHPLPKDYVPELIEYNKAKMHPLMKDDYIRLRDDVQERTGVRIYVVSDYRTAEEQLEILQSSQSGIAAGVGCSEHEAGLALDVYAPHFDGMQFLNSLSGRMINRICHEYGFIIRYPKDKVDVTGISYEPWHLRYVGKTHARIMTACGLAMEEYISFFTPGVWYRTDDGVMISRRSADDLLLPEGWSSCEISPDNAGYYFITLYY